MSKTNNKYPLPVILLAGIILIGFGYSIATPNTNTNQTETNPPALASGIVDEKSSFSSQASEPPKQTEIIKQSTTIDKQEIITRITYFFKEKNSPLTEKEAETFFNLGIKYKRHPYSAVAVAFADSSLGRNLTTPYNLGNVGNTDSCPTCQSFTSWSEGIEAIYQTLTNQYLGKASKLCHLSRGGWQFCPEGKTINNGKFYASSITNWDNNSNYAMSWLMNSAFSREFSILI